MASEELALGQGSTGGEQDIEHATWLAREIVGRYGMSEKLGRVRLLAHDADEFLGATLGLQDMSQRMHEEFDVEVRSLLEAAEERAREIVKANKAVLEAMVSILLERETLEGQPLLDALSPVVSPPRAASARRKRGVVAGT